MIIAGMWPARPASRLAVGASTLLVWALAAGGVAYWALRLAGGEAPVQVPVATALDPDARVDGAAVARALGARQARSAPADDDLSRRVVLRGVLTHGHDGAALIAVDGQPARPLRVGASLDALGADWTLRAVTPHAAVLASAGRELRLELPPLDQRSRAADAAVAPGGRAGTAPMPAAVGRPIGVPSPGLVPGR